MILAPLLLAFAAPLLPCDLQQDEAQRVPPFEPPPIAEPAELADPATPHGVLRYELREHGGRLMPGRLTFVRRAGEILDLFPNTRVRPHDLAVRRNVVYTLSGQGSITVPVGDYTVYATRGIEWSLAAERILIEEGQEAELKCELQHEVSTPGWVSGDFHLHTLTYSGHGDADLNERLISLIGEGVEFAVATDHNHHTDYEPTILELGAEDRITTVTGNEISVPIGHLNAFPLEPDRPVLDPGARDARELFKLIRGEPNRYGVVPVIQLNHPRWKGIDFFTQAKLDPITGLAGSETWSDDFDTIEIFNSNPGWGYYDADLPGDREVGGNIHCVLQDWYNLLNRGHRYFAVGNSDSHAVHHNFAGYPRNYIQSMTDLPGKIDPAEIAAELRLGHVYTTLGPVVDFRVNGQPSGSLVNADDGRVQVNVRIQTPVWIYVNRVKIVLNGDVIETRELDPMVRPDGRLRWPTVRAVVEVTHDSWIHVIVEGDESLDPIVCGADRPILPLAVTNPVWVEHEIDGRWTSPWDWAKSSAPNHVSIGRLRPHEAALVVLALVDHDRPDRLRTIQTALGSSRRPVQLAALRAAEALALPIFTPPLLSILTRAEDPFLALTAARALSTCDPADASSRLVTLFERFGGDALQRYPVELERLMSAEAVREWKVIGPFPNPTPETLFEASLGPESDADPSRAHEGKNGPVEWQDPTVTAAGYVDLGAIDLEHRDGSIHFAQTWLHVDEAREVPYTIGSDDGCRLWVGGREVFRDPTRHTASPLQHVGKLELAAGWNRVLVGVENGGGLTGLYFLLLDREDRAAAERP